VRAASELPTGVRCSAEESQNPSHLVETRAFEELDGAVPKAALWKAKKSLTSRPNARAGSISVETEGLPWPRCKSIPFDFSNTRSPRGV